MNEEEIVILKEVFYDKLRDGLKCDGKLKSDSIIRSFFKTTPNALLDIIIDSSVEYSTINRTILTALINGNYIKVSSKPNEYIITPKGIWEIETKLETVDINTILTHLDDKFFKIDDSPLSSKEKVVLLSLIAIRAFYEKTPLNRKNSVSSQEKVNEILLESKQFLQDMNIINDFKLSSPNEDPVESVFRRMTELKKKIGNLYQFGNGKLWLVLYNTDYNANFANDDLSYLLWKIFGSDLTYNQQKTIVDFCDQILRKYKNYVFNDEEFENHIFSRAEFEDVINNSLLSIPLLKDGWEKS